MEECFYITARDDKRDGDVVIVDIANVLSAAIVAAKAAMQVSTYSNVKLYSVLANRSVLINLEEITDHVPSI